MSYRWALLVCVLLVFIPYSAMAVDKEDMGGWELGSEYNKLYDVNELDNFKAVVAGFETASPLPGMSPATILLVTEPDSDEIIKVHICPEWFATPDRIGLRKGERIKVRGAWAVINGEDVVMGSKIKKDGNWSYKVRLTSDGTPFWTMSPGQLAKERQSD